eukprot:314436_1
MVQSMLKCSIIFLLSTFIWFQETLSVILLDSNDIGWKWEGLGGEDYVGGARLLFEYPEPIRTQIFDLLFSPNIGTYWQLLKTEMNGDVDSSMGSGSSYMHYQNENNPNQWNRGTHYFVLKEARLRQPNIVLSTLSWGDPYWVGNNTYLSSGGVDYHINWLQSM